MDPEPVNHCPNHEELGNLLRGSMQGQEAIAARAHVTDCARCAAELELLRSWEEAEPTAAERTDLAWIEAKLGGGLETRKWWSVLLPQGLLPRMAVSVAAVILLIAGGVQLRNMRMPEPGPAESNEYRSGALLVETPIGDLQTIPNEFRWRAASGAVKYRVIVAEVDGTQIWTGESSNSSLFLPEELRSMLLPGKTVVWHVMALDNTGRVLGESSPERFRFTG